MAKFQKVNPEGREALRQRAKELDRQDLDQRNKQTSQWESKRLIDKHVKNAGGGGKKK